MVHNATILLSQAHKNYLSVYIGKIVYTHTSIPMYTHS